MNCVQGFGRRERSEGDVLVRPATPTEILNWDELVVRFENYRIFHKKSWIRSVEAFSGSRAVYLVLEQNGEVVAALPGFLVKMALLKLFVSPREGWQAGSMGPVFARGRISTHELFAALIPFLEKQYGVQHIELVSPDLDAGSMEALGFRGESLFTYRIRLFPGEEERTLRAVHSRTRRYLRNLPKTGLTVAVESEESFVDEFYEQIKEVFARRGNTVPFSRMRVLQLFRHLKESGNLLALSVRGPNSGACMATGIFTIEGQELYIWGWTHRSEYGRYHPTELLTWTAMRTAMERGCVTFDMAGGGDAKIKFGAIPDLTLRRWIRSRYKWLTWLRRLAKDVYKWQQSLRGEVARRLTSRPHGDVQADNA